MEGVIYQQTANNGPPPPPPTTTTTTPRNLTELPTEIIEGILEWLVPPPPEIGESKPVAFSQMVEGEFWHDFILCRRALAKVCLVSRGLASIARPLLYRNIAVWEEESLVLLFRTLVENPTLGSWNRFLACQMTLTAPGVIRNIRNAVHKHVQDIKPASEPQVIMRTIEPVLKMTKILQTYPFGVDLLPQTLLSYILMLLPKLETLLLWVPMWDNEDEYDALIGNVKEMKQQIKSPEHMPFQHLHTVMFQGNPAIFEHLTVDDCDCDIPDVWGVQPRHYHEMLACFPALNTLEAWADDGYWSHPKDPMDDVDFGGFGFHAVAEGNHPPYLAGIKHIYLHQSYAAPMHLNRLLKNAPDLQTLYMAPRYESPDKHYEPLSPSASSWMDQTEDDPNTLDTGLRLYAGKLKSLDVGWLNVRLVGMGENEIGYEGRLPSLPQLTNLERLCIQLSTLYGPTASSAASSQYQLIDLLPPNLVELTLEDWWWQYERIMRKMAKWDNQKKLTHYQSHADYRAAATSLLIAFAQALSPAKMPHLKKVLLLCKIPWTWVMTDSEDIQADFHFRFVTEEFRKRGVVFEVSCEDGSAELPTGNRCFVCPIVQISHSQA
ncbi:hypothetical protein QBC35DRAFT_498448 [Podospora australis]|uniref:Uncharacterized protein n=1 Tax=Podospora australis TaxID=1536484 RepID=A0AAN7AHK3_9PEZI|nr:hypothetical protein QBC35DRAFT_498448 [Podospora australis]